ncbi:MAG: shikimate dehydrogenase [Polyangiales bacterium]|nr:shikimate dehydrogenase [Sandaracinus sp.]
MSEVMKVFGILGYPVSHSRSPAMQEAAFRARGIDARYVPFPVAPERLGDAIRGLRALGVMGANVTVPHKEAVLAELDEVEPAARAMGAVNTLVRDGDRWIGTNTDAEGLARSLDEVGAVVGDRLVVLGAGGAARAAVVGLGARAREVVVAARRVSQAEALVASLALDGVKLSACGMDALDTPFESASTVVQATSATLGEGADAFVTALPLDALPKDATLVDLVYVPRRTALLVAGEARGLRTVEGVGMLVHQGALAFERWTGVEAPVDVMREALLATL